MKMALFRPLGVGSLLCAVPALRALDAAYPDAHITLIGLPRVRELAARLRRYLDGFAAFPGFPGMVGSDCDLDAVPDFFQRMRSQCFDLAIQLGAARQRQLDLFGKIHGPAFLFVSNCRSRRKFFSPRVNRAGAVPACAVSGARNSSCGHGVIHLPTRSLHGKDREVG